MGLKKSFEPKYQRGLWKNTSQDKKQLRVDFPDFTLVAGFWRRRAPDWSCVCLFFSALYEMPQRHHDLEKSMTEQTHNLYENPRL